MDWRLTRIEHSVRPWAVNKEIPIPDHLEPEDSPFSLPEVFPVYQYLADLLKPAHREVMQIACEHLYPEIASVTCQPTYWWPWTLAVIGEQKFGYTLLLTEQADLSLPSDLPLSQSAEPANENVSEPMQNARVVHRRSQLPTELAGTLCSAWRRVVSETRYACDPILGKCDGDTYHFTYCHYRKTLPLAGQTWSPRNDSVPGHMVALSQALRNYVFGRDPIAELRDALHGFVQTEDENYLQRIEREVTWLETARK